MVRQAPRPKGERPGSKSQAANLKRNSISKSQAGLEMDHWALRFVCHLSFDDWRLAAQTRADSPSERGALSSARGDAAKTRGDASKERGDLTKTRADRAKGRGDAPSGPKEGGPFRNFTPILPANAPPAAPATVLWGGDEGAVTAAAALLRRNGEE